MFIPYENLKILLGNSCPKVLQDFLYKKKIEQNLAYIESNIKKVKAKLKQKYKNEKIKVVFYVYDEAKWKCQTLYDLISEDSDFEVEILVTKSAAKNIDNPTYQSIEDVKRTYHYFKKLGMNVNYAYDIDKNLFIPFSKFNPDIIIYQHPWYVETSQGPVVCSKFALTYYVPYFVANAGLKEDYYLRFHQYVYKHCLLNDSLVEYFSPKMDNHGKNLISTGHPQLDYFFLNKKQFSEKKYVIYAPHWSILGTSLAYGTFEWSGQLVLEFAKNHPEINWVFKPHPLLKKSLIDTAFMNIDQVEKYYNEWNKIGIKCETPDYLNLFSESKAMITDCGSFLTEYFLTGNPVIHLQSGAEQKFCPHCIEIIKNYYKAGNKEELSDLLDKIILKNDDNMKMQRLSALEKSNLCNTYAAKNIFDNIKNFDVIQ